MAMLWESAQSGKPTVPYPQAEDEDTPGTFTKLKGKNGAANMRVVGANGNKMNVGADGSIAVTDDGQSLTIDSAQLPSVLGVHGALIIEGIANGTPVTVSGTVEIGSALPSGDNLIGRVKVTDDYPTVFAFETITVSTSVLPLTSSTYTDAVEALITVEDNPVRFRIGGDPTSTVGHLLEAGDKVLINTATDIAAFRAIRQGSADAKIVVSYSHRV